jgi:hypothetical protein
MVGGRLTGHYTHSFLMAAIVDQPVSAGSSAAFVDAVRGAYSAQDPKSRFKTVRAFARHYGEPGVFCAEFEAVVNERDNPNYPGMLLLMEQHGIICLHRSLKFTVRLETSERRPAGEPSFLDQTSRHEADAFLRSLMIDAYREAPSSSGGAAPGLPREAEAGSGSGTGRERWVQIFEHEGTGRVFIDAASVVTTGTERRASIKMDFPPRSIRGPAPAGPAFADKWLDFVIFQAGFNCTERLMRQEAATAFFEDGSQTADRSRPFPQPWQPPCSVQWEITALKMVCGDGH